MIRTYNPYRPWGHVSHEDIAEIPAELAGEIPENLIAQW